MPLPIRLVKVLARAVGAKKRVTATFRKAPRRKVGACRAVRFGSRFETEEWQVEGRFVTTVRPADPLAVGNGPGAERGDAAAPHEPRRHVVFLHGGGYTTEASLPHRLMIERLVHRYGLVVTFVDYPLVPEHQAEDTHRMLEAAYREIVLRNPGDGFCLVGDSAGGGLALAFRRILRDRARASGAAAPDLPLPVACVLISPWLDVTMSNPALAADAERDPVLSVEGCVEAGLRYAGAADPKDPRISPIFGTFEDLGRFLVFVGTEELFRADCVLLAERLQAAEGSSAEIQVEPGMVHDWVLAPSKESRLAVERMVRFLRSSAG